MLCEFCDCNNVCKYKEDTISYERNFNTEKIPLSNLSVELKCKYYHSSTNSHWTWTYNDSICQSDSTYTDPRNINTIYTTI